jgi:PKD repeat protein
MEIIRYNGSPDKVVNLVIMGDGYTANQQAKFSNDVRQVIDGMFLQEPWKAYANKINVYAIKVVSNVTGAATRPSEPIDNYFGSSFNTSNIERLLYPFNISRVVGVLNTNIPFFDIGVIIVNDNRYGGSGGTFATFSTHPDALEIMIHELGHSFSRLSDEYWAGDQFARETANMSKDSNPATNRWRGFIGTGEVGIYAHVESPTWFRPHQNCKMRFLGRDFCAVCASELKDDIETLTVPDDLQRPVAFFGAEKLEVFEGETVKFFDLSTQSPTEWSWTFEGASPEFSGVQNPNVTYPSEGDWLVSLSTANGVGSSNISRSQFIKVKKDREAPFLKVKDLTVHLNEAGKAQITAFQVDNGTTDNAGIREISLSRTSFDCSNVGPNEVIFLATDIFGNSASTTVKINVLDSSPPIVKTKNLTLRLDADGNGTISPEDIDDGSFDNCSLESLRLSRSVFGRNNGGSNQVTLFAKDQSGNESSATATVTVDIILSSPREKREHIALYPNPANDMIYIAYPKIIDADLSQVELLNTNGNVLKIITEIPETGNQIPIEIGGNPNGVYFLRLVSKNEINILKFTISR